MRDIDKQFSELQKRCKETNNEIEKLKREASYEIKKAVVNVTEEELEDIKADICDNYCKKLAEYNEKSSGLEAVYNFDEFLDEVCSKCPLSRL